MRKHTLYDFSAFKLETCFVTYKIDYPGEFPSVLERMCILQLLARVFHKCQVWVVVSVSQVCYIYADFLLLVLSIIQSGSLQLLLLSSCFFLQFCKVLLCVFWGSSIRCICVYNCYIFLMN